MRLRCACVPRNNRINTSDIRIKISIVIDVLVHIFIVIITRISSTKGAGGVGCTQPFRGLLFAELLNSARIASRARRMVSLHAK